MMPEKEQMMIWCIQDLKNIERLFKGNDKVIQEQREITEYAINQYLQEAKELRTNVSQFYCDIIKYRGDIYASTL